MPDEPYNYMAPENLQLWQDMINGFTVPYAVEQLTLHLVNPVVRFLCGKGASHAPIQYHLTIVNMFMERMWFEPINPDGDNWLEITYGRINFD